MNHNIGALALVGSGEYTEPLLDLERELIEVAKRKGKNGPYVQFATAAGEEHADRIEYWKSPRIYPCRRYRHIGSLID